MYPDTLYFIRCKVTVNTVCICIYKASFIFSIIVHLRTSDCEVSCIACNCTSYSNVASLFLVLFYQFKLQYTILNIRSLITAHVTACHLSVQIVQEQFRKCTHCALAVLLDFLVLVDIDIEQTYFSVKPTSVKYHFIIDFIVVMQQSVVCTRQCQPYPVCKLSTISIVTMHYLLTVYCRS